MKKTVTGILNLQLAAVIQFHDTIHEFRAGRGYGTASRKEKLLQKLMGMREEVLYEIFLYLHKVYDSLDGKFCLDILEAYGLGLREIRLLRRYWYQLTMVSQAGGY